MDSLALEMSERVGWGQEIGGAVVRSDGCGAGVHTGGEKSVEDKKTAVRSPTTSNKSWKPSIRSAESVSRRIRYRWSRLWTLTLFTIQLTIMVLGLLSLIMTAIKKRKTWETQAQMATVFWPTSLIFFLVIAIANPLKEGNRFELMSSAAQSVTFITTYLRESIVVSIEEDGFTPKVLSPISKAVFFGIISVIMTHLVLKKRDRVAGRGKDGIGRKSMRHLITQNLPLTFGSVMVSVLYVASESMGCVMRRHTDNIECWDIVSSNYSFSMIFVTFFFMSNYAVPFAQSRVTKSLEREMTMENLFMFKLPPKEQFGLIIFIFAMMTGLMLFASSDEQDELHKLDNKSTLYTLYYKERSSILKEIDLTSNSLRTAREALNLFTTCTCIIVAISTFIPNKTIKSSMKQMHSRLHLSSSKLTQFAPLYVYIFIFLIILFFSLVLIYLGFVLADVNAVGGTWSKKGSGVWAPILSRLCNYSWPAMATFVIFVFFSKPRHPTPLTTNIYFVIPTYLVIKGFCDSLLEMGFVNAVFHYAGAMFMTLFFKVVLRARKFLSLMDDETLEAHLLNTFVKIGAAVPPIIFLLFEAISCPYRYSNPTIEGAGFFEVDEGGACNAQRPSFDETFCQWAIWKNVTGDLELGENKYRVVGGEAASDMKKDTLFFDVCSEHIDSGGETFSFPITIDKSWNITDNGLPHAGDYVNWNFQDPCPLEVCDGVGIPNLVVILHLTGMLVYWIIFGFMYKRSTWDDIATLNPDTTKFHLLYQVVAIGFASALSFFTFGTRSENSTVLVGNIKIYLLVSVITIWGSCFFIQGLSLRSSHMFTEGNLEHVVSIFGNTGNESAAMASSPRSHQKTHSPAFSKFQAATKKVQRQQQQQEGKREEQQNQEQQQQQQQQQKQEGTTSGEQSDQPWRKKAHKRRQSLITKSFQPSRLENDLPTRILIWLDDVCEHILRKYIASNEKDRIAELYRIVLGAFVVLPIILIIFYRIDPYDGYSGFFWTFDLMKFFGMHAVVVLVQTNFTESIWTDRIFLASMPLTMILSLSSPIAFVGEDSSESKSNMLSDSHAGLSNAVFTCEKVLTVILSIVSTYVCVKCKNCMMVFMEPEERAGHVIDSGFMVGIISSMIPLIYVCSEGIGCIWRNHLESLGGVALVSGETLNYIEDCGSIIWGVKAFMLQSVIVFMYGINVGPLVAKTIGAISVSTVVRLRLMGFELVEMLLLLVTTCLALWLFGSRHEGMPTENNAWMFNALLLAWIASFSAEIYNRRWDKIDSSNQTNRSSSGLKRLKTNLVIQKKSRLTEQQSGGNNLTRDDEDDTDEEDGKDMTTLDFSPGLV